MNVKLTASESGRALKIYALEHKERDGTVAIATPSTLLYS